MPVPPNDPMQSPSLEHRTLLWLVVGASIGFAVVLWPYLGAVLWAIFIAIVFEPLHLRVLRQTRDRRSLAALLSLFLILVIVILPLIMVGASVVQEASILVQKLRSGEVDGGALDALGIVQQPHAPRPSSTASASSTCSRCNASSLRC